MFTSCHELVDTVGEGHKGHSAIKEVSMSQAMILFIL